MKEEEIDVEDGVNAEEEEEEVEAVEVEVEEVGGRDEEKAEDSRPKTRVIPDMFKSTTSMV